MKSFIQLFFGLIVLFFLLILALWFSTPPEQVTGFTDTAFSTLQKSGVPIAAVATPKWLGFLFGYAIIGLFAFGVFLGAKKKDKSIQQKIYRALGIGTLLYLLVYTLMVTSWWSYTETNSMEYFMGLPKPTAWMFALLFTPFFISFFYITKFKEWIYTAEDEAVFKEIMERRKREGRG